MATDWLPYLIWPHKSPSCESNTTLQSQSHTENYSSKFLSECAVELKDTVNPPFPHIVLSSCDSRLPLNFDQRSTIFYSPIIHTRHSESLATHTTPGADHRPRLICLVKKNRTCRSQLHPTTTPAKCGTFSPSTRRVGVASGEFVASWDMQALSSGFDRGDTDAARSYYGIPGGLGGTSTTFDLSTNRGYWPASGRRIHHRRVVITFSSSAKAAFGHSAHSGLHISGLQAVNHLRHCHSIAVVAPDPPPNHRF